MPDKICIILVRHNKEKRMLNILAIPQVVSIGSVNIALADIIAVVILLIALIIGAVQGFARQVLSFLGWIAAIALAGWLCVKVSDFVCEKWPSVLEFFTQQVSKLFGGADITLNGTETKEEIINLLATTKIPSFLHSAIADAIIKNGYQLALFDMLGKWIVNAVCFIVLFIVAMIIFALLKKLFKALTKLPVIRVIDKLLGMILAVALATVFLMVACVVITPFVPSLNDYLVPTDGVTKCYFNEVLTYLTNLEVVKNFLSQIMTK